jgi:hypothetical protein
MIPVKKRARHLVIETLMGSALHLLMWPQGSPAGTYHLLVS